MTRSLATFLAMRKRPSLPCSTSWPATNASRSAASRAGVGGVARRGRQLGAVEGAQGRQRVVDELVDQCLPGRAVVPVARRLAGAVVIVVARQGPSHRAGELRSGIVQYYQQLPDRGPQLGDGVLGGDGVIEGGRVDHASPVAHGAG